MKRTGRNTARLGRASGLALVLWATAAAAQQPLPSPAPPSEPPPPATPTEIAVPGVAVPLAAATTWTLGMDVGAHWDSNLRLSTDAQETLSERLGLHITHAKRSGRATLALGVDAFGALYHDETALNTGSFAGASSGTYLLDPRTTFRGGLAAGYGYAPESEALAADGLLLPFSQVLTLSATAGLARRLSTRASLAADVRYDRADFSEAEGGQARPLDGSGIHVSGSLGTSVSTHDSLSLGYEFRRTQSGNPTGDNHTGSLGWTRSIGTRFSMNASGGATRYVLGGTGATGWTFRSLAGLSARFRRSELAARYDRGIEPAFGFGRDRLSNVVAVSYAAQPGRKTRLSLEGAYGLTSDPRDSEFRFDTQAVMARFGYLLTRRMDLSASYAFRRQQPQTGAAVVGHAVGASLGFSREWRR